MNQTFKTILISAVTSLVVIGVAFWSWQNYAQPSKQELIRDFYATENAVTVSPHGLRVKMDKGDKSFILVDLRSAQEYEKEHVIGAINIPAYKDPNTSAYDEVDRIVGAFQKLPKDKDIIVYCYSTPCMTGRKVGQMLADKEMYVKHLGIGWNEWRHFWTLWNHEHEWKTTKPEDYISTGKEPGVVKVRQMPSLCGTGDFGC